MYYRRKLLLGLMEKLDRPVNNTELQKFLFLVTKEQSSKKKSFYFVPYQFGCYSFQANADMNTLLKYDKVQKEQFDSKITWSLKGDENYFHLLKDFDQKSVFKVLKKFKEYSTSELIKYTYIKYPYWAINSKIKEKLLSQEQLEPIENAIKKLDKKDVKLFTIGYEGISLEEYVNKLIVNDIKLLCDVRKNPFSMKRGFSKKELSHACRMVNINYLHIPELGIISEKRKNLKTQKDYNVLFKEYENTVLVDNFSYLIKVKNVLTKNKRIALTCFEAHSCMCHRSRISKKLEQLPEWSYKVQHL